MLCYTLALTTSLSMRERTVIQIHLPSHDTHTPELHLYGSPTHNSAHTHAPSVRGSINSSGSSELCTVGIGTNIPEKRFTPIKIFTVRLVTSLNVARARMDVNNRPDASTTEKRFCFRTWKVKNMMHKMCTSNYAFSNFYVTLSYINRGFHKVIWLHNQYCIIKSSYRPDSDRMNGMLSLIQGFTFMMERLRNKPSIPESRHPA